MKKQNSLNVLKTIDSLSELKRFVSKNSKESKLFSNTFLKLQNLVNTHGEAFEQIHHILISLHHNEVLHNPTVYIARTRDTKTDIEYFTAKTVLRLRNGKKKEVKIHLGRASDYNNNTRSAKAKSDAIAKMKLTLIRRMGEGSL